MFYFGTGMNKVHVCIHVHAPLGSYNSPLRPHQLVWFLFGIYFTLVKNFPSGKQTRLFNISDPSVYSPGGVMNSHLSSYQKLKIIPYFGITGKSVLHRPYGHTTPLNF